MGISFGLFIFSVVISIPFMISTKLKQMFDDPGEFDHIAFCVESIHILGFIFLYWYGKIFVFDVRMMLIFTLQNTVKNSF